MKALVLGVCGIGGAGTAAYFGAGGGGPNDFIGTVSRPPSAVYAAFAGLGQSGETIIPSSDGTG